MHRSVGLAQQVVAVEVVTIGRRDAQEIQHGRGDAESRNCSRNDPASWDSGPREHQWDVNLVLGQSVPMTEVVPVVPVEGLAMVGGENHESVLQVTPPTELGQEPTRLLIEIPHLGAIASEVAAGVRGSRIEPELLVGRDPS